MCEYNENVLKPYYHYLHNSPMLNNPEMKSIILSLINNIEMSHNIRKENRKGKASSQYKTENQNLFFK